MALALFAGIQSAGLALAAQPSKGQALYVPVYSSIYFGDRQRVIHLAVTLSLRNTDPSATVTVERVTYRDEQGRLIAEQLKEAAMLGPLESRSIFIRESDTSGGVGASFIVEWKAEKPVSPLIAEAVMIGVQTQQGLSFTSRGEVISER